MCVFCLHIYTCIIFVSGAYRVQKSVSDPVELGQQRVVSCHVGSGTSAKVTSAPNL